MGKKTKQNKIIFKYWRQKESDLKREGKRKKYIWRVAREKMFYLMSPQLKKIE